MKKLVVLVALIVVSFESAIACSIIITPLRKEFRRANTVFTGKVTQVNAVSLTEIEKSKLVPKNWRSWDIFSKVTVEVHKRWKGSLSGTNEFLAVAFFSCGCETMPLQYDLGKEYLVFAEKANFITICDSRVTQMNNTKTELTKLDSFGFRLWARIYPF